MDFYQVLGIGRDATPDQIKASFRKLAIVWHPDKRPADREEAERKFKLISEAYDTLFDPMKKSVYDQRNPPKVKATKPAKPAKQVVNPKYSNFTYIIDQPEPKFDLWGDPIVEKSPDAFKDSFAGKYNDDFGMPQVRGR
jgi:DnaJ-class molecular chaperone